jgi:hypothetical protein
MNGEELAGLVVEHEMGVRRRPLDLLELSEGTDDPTGIAAD